MTNKDIIKEIIWLLAGLIICYGIAILLFPSSNMYLSDIYVGTSPSSGTENLLGKMSSTLTFLVALFFLFPILFIVYSVRGLFQKFSSRPFNVFLMLICFLSLLISVLFSLTYEPIVTMVTGSWTIYPPLSALPEFTPPENLDTWLYSIISFIVLQTLVLFVTARQVFKKQK